MTRHEDIWREQCDATAIIQSRYGEKAALDYLIGEKLLLFTSTAQEHPAFAAQLPAFIGRVRQMFAREAIMRYLGDLEVRLIEESHEVDPDDIILESRATRELNSLQQVADLLRAESLGTA